MEASKIRDRFFKFFEEKGHKIVPSAPIVNKNDPTLMFINAGMNQFKDYFLGNKISTNKRIADTQKCLRVSGKHNDLEEVGRDSYHHTMFEMLGNWSFGDYFKKEAIEWAWELLVDEFGLPKDRLYVTVFGGDDNEGLDKDAEAAKMWKSWVPEDHILYFGKKDNFWEMGDVGPCGPCSEIHIDLRSDEERKSKPAQELVNMDDPMVIELWNLVFIQFNRRANGDLENLPDKHIDTGMGFERLCMAMQGKTSNYDTDVFMPFINKIERLSGIKYTSSYEESAKTDIAMRVMVDHLRAVSFAISDGELPSNTGAGYVIRRILRRAVRYYYSFLNLKQPSLYQLVDDLAINFQNVFPELLAQKDFVEKVIFEEEKSFLNTLQGGLSRFEQLDFSSGMIDGSIAFELYDTYGFPIDLTMLIAEEKGLKVDEVGFEKALEEQKNRSRRDAKKTTGDWEEVMVSVDTEFVGYDHLKAENTKLVKYRVVIIKDKPQYQLVLSQTPFYAQGGGQVGDRGRLWFGEEKIKVIDTLRENDLIIHIVDKLPTNKETDIKAEVHPYLRKMTENNHTATHLLHAALRQVLGDHVQQKGSLVNEDYLRFDFSHFQKMTQDQIAQVEEIVNRKIRENIKVVEDRSIPIEAAKSSGAMMLFGEKYGDSVRMITVDPQFSIELCGGCHVSATGNIGVFKIISETAIAAGVRRIEARTADAAEDFINSEFEELNAIRGLFKNSVNTAKNVFSLQEENKKLLKEIEKLKAAQAGNLQSELINKFEEINGVNFLSANLGDGDAKQFKTLAYNLEKEKGNAFIVFGFSNNGKAQLMITISEALSAKDSKFHAGTMIRELAKNIQGGGGGQAFFATAGGKNIDGIPNALDAAKQLI